MTEKAVWRTCRFFKYTQRAASSFEKKRQRENRGLESTKTDYNSKFHKQVIMIDQNRDHLRVTVAMLTFGVFLG